MKNGGQAGVVGLDRKLAISELDVGRLSRRIEER
jgi:hypothetical protein